VIEQQQLAPGYKFNGRYEVLKPHGRGSLGDSVYIGRHPDLEKEIIIRVLPPEMATSPDVINRFLQAVKLTALLKHQNILPAYDAGTENGMLYFVSASETGLYLSDYIKMKGRLGQDEAVKIVLALADALDYAWKENKILHRNVCPSTILIGSGVHPMITDFGLAKSFEVGNDSLTVTGYTIGNPQYMSPEQARGERELTFHADMYCLGLLFYEMLAGQPAFQFKSHYELMEAQMEKNPKPLEKYNSEVTAECISIIDKMMDKRKERRYATWQALASDLKDLRDGKSTAAARPPARKPAQNPVLQSKAYGAYSPQSRRSSPVAAIIIAAVIILSIAGAAIAFLKFNGR